MVQAPASVVEAAVARERVFVVLVVQQPEELVRPLPEEERLVAAAQPAGEERLAGGVEEEPLVQPVVLLQVLVFLVPEQPRQRVRQVCLQQQVF